MGSPEMAATRSTHTLSVGTFRETLTRLHHFRTRARQLLTQLSALTQSAQIKTAALPTQHFSARSQQALPTMSMWWQSMIFPYQMARVAYLYGILPYHTKPCSGTPAAPSACPTIVDDHP